MGAEEKSPRFAATGSAALADAAVAAVECRPGRPGSGLVLALVRVAAVVLDAVAGPVSSSPEDTLGHGSTFVGGHRLIRRIHPCGCQIELDRLRAPRPSWPF